MILVSHRLRRITTSTGHNQADIQHSNLSATIQASRLKKAHYWDREIVAGLELLRSENLSPFSYGADWSWPWQRPRGMSEMQKVEYVQPSTALFHFISFHFIYLLAGQPGVARAFAPRWTLSLRSPSSAELSRLPITPSRGEHIPLWRKLLFDRWTCKIQLSLLEKVTGVIKYLCVHYRPKKKSKEKSANCETST